MVWTIRRGLMLAALAVSAAASAEQPSTEGHGGGHGGELSVADFIFHHVSDSHEYEFEIPLNQGHNPTLHLDQVFSFLKIEAVAGACGHEPHGNIDRFKEFFAGCFDLRPTKHTIMMWGGALLLLLAMLGLTHRDRTRLVPRGTWANLFESLVVFVRDEIAVKNIGKEDGPRYTPYLLTAFFFILFINLLGLFPWMATATGNLAVTIALALCTFIVTQVASVRAAGFGGYLKHLTGGVPWPLWPIMIPIEFIGLFTKPFALTVRLFANMLAGHIVIFFLLGLIFLMKTVGASVMSVPLAMGIYFLELFVAFVQAYVFTMLSSIFIGMGVAMGHHHEANGHEAHGHEAHGQTADKGHAVAH